ncbi:D-aminopeptidase [Frigidibacter sp. MR17.24]|uniref:D-aminopeptidase n=1 Tax=Frigidibacter sp. MR17.24 TaxID=3127345 RepID=UPI003013181A
MTPDLDAALAQLDRLPDLYPGPGGVAGIVHEGRVVAARAWGHATVAGAVAMTTATALPICSISKQFTCAAFLAHLEPETMEHRLADHLPLMGGARPGLRQMMANQSGLRDYWALAPLLGALPEGEFRRSDGPAVYGRMRTGHFAPGTSYSYCNQNFRIAADILQDETGRDLAEIYDATLFGPAGMAGARISPDTAVPPPGVTGYEGSPERGHVPVVNRLYWKGDAGITASIDDMLAWECFIDATRDDETGLYRRISAPPVFSNGAPASYGFGLAHERLPGGQAATGHGGALRGFRAYRMHVAEARLSAVVIFNHEADAHGAANRLIGAALGTPAPAPGRPGPVAGVWRDPTSGLLIRVDPALQGQTLRFATGPDPLRADGTGDGLRITPEGEGLRMVRPGENLDLLAEPVAPGPGGAIDGLYHWDELDAWLRIETRDGATHAVASGHFGTAQPERLHAVGRDTWVMPVLRSVDAPAPGDWTVSVRRAADGTPQGLTVGCWLARGLSYRRVSA